MILVTTPTGQIGSQVLHHLLAHDADLRVVARHPDKLPAEIRDRIEVVTGSMGDATTINAATEGVDAVFWLPPPNPFATTLDEVYAGLVRPACAAFAANGVARVVGISSLGRGTPVEGRAGYITASLAVDDLIGASGVAYRALTMPSFMDNTSRQAGLIRDRGIITTPLPLDLALPLTATRDISAVAAGLLLDDTWTGVEERPVLGPEDISAHQMAATISEVLGREVRAVRVSLDDVRAQMEGIGASEEMTRGRVDMMSAVEQGLYSAAVRTEETASPTTFRAWCEDVLEPLVEAG